MLNLLGMFFGSTGSLLAGVVMWILGKLGVKFYAEGSLLAGFVINLCCGVITLVTPVILAFCLWPTMGYDAIWLSVVIYLVLALMNTFYALVSVFGGLR